MERKTFDDFVNSFNGKKVKLGNNSWNVLCPAHNDREPSLTITGNENKILIKCQAGCATEAVLKAKGLTIADLFLDDKPSNKREIVGRYLYQDESGNTLYEVLRYEPKSFSVRRPDGKGGYIAGLGDVKKVIYNLPKVIEAIKNDIDIWQVEGERDANRLNECGLVATTSPFGAKKWLDQYSEYLRDAKVILVPDNDQEGTEHMNMVAVSLEGKAKSIKLLRLDVPEKEDVTWWLEQGGTKEALREFGLEAPKYKYHSTNTKRVRTLTEVMETVGELPRGLWGDFLFPQSIMFFSGETGAGKTTFVWNLASKLSVGGDFLDFPIPKPLRIIFYDLESPDPLVKRRASLIDSTNTDNISLAPPFNNFITDYDTIVKDVKDEFDVVVIDTQSVAFNTRSEDDNAEATREMKIARKFVNETGVALILIHHMGNISDGKKGIFKARGATARPSLADVVVNFEGITEDTVRFEQVKNRVVGGTHTFFVKKVEGQFILHTPTGYSDTMETFRAEKAILALLEGKVMVQRKAIEDALEPRGFSKATIGRALTYMLQIGEIWKPKFGYYALKREGLL